MSGAFVQVFLLSKPTKTPSSTLQRCLFVSPASTAVRCLLLNHVVPVVYSNQGGGPTGCEGAPRSGEGPVVCARPLGCMPYNSLHPRPLTSFQQHLVRRRAVLPQGPAVRAAPGLAVSPPGLAVPPGPAVRFLHQEQC